MRMSALYENVGMSFVRCWVMNFADEEGKANPSYKLQPERDVMDTTN